MANPCERRGNESVTIWTHLPGRVLIRPAGSAASRAHRRSGVEALSLRPGRKPCLVWLFLIGEVVLHCGQSWATVWSGEVCRGPEPAVHRSPIDPADEILPQPPGWDAVEGVDEVG